MEQPFTYKRLLQYFLQGLLILAPIAITFWAIAAAFGFIDGILPNLIHSFVPGLMEDAQGNVKRIPGVGFVLVISLVLLVGYISSSFIFTRIVEVFDKVLQKTP